MKIYNNIRIGKVRVINTNARENENPEEERYVALDKDGKPLKKYCDYYKIEKTEQVKGFITDSGITRLIRERGKEVRVLKKTTKRIA